MLAYRFNELKTAQAAAHLLARAGGEMYYIALVKIMYLADREVFLRTGLPLTGDEWFSMKNGPVLSRVLNLTNDDPETPSVWRTYVTPPEGFRVRLARPSPEDEELSDAEISILDGMFDQYGRMDRFDLCNLTHTICPEWRDPGTSSLRISPREILVAEGKSEEEIEAYREASESALFLDSVQVS